MVGDEVRDMNGRRHRVGSAIQADRSSRGTRTVPERESQPASIGNDDPGLARAAER